MDTLRHGMSGYRIPAYIEEILTHNYCPCFMRMTIIRDGQNYRFSYRPGRMSRLNTGSLGTYDKLILLSSLIRMNDTAEGYLISADNYLIEPELIYSEGNSTAYRKIRILFYPDIKRMRFERKLLLFTERIKDDSSREEREILGQLEEVLEGSDINRARLMLDKNLIRIENRTLSKAG